MQCHVCEYERYVTILLVHARMCVSEIYIYIHVIRVKAKVTSSDVISLRKTIMEACNVVEREVDKILLKFGVVNEHAETVLQDLINHIESLKREFTQGKLKALPLLTMPSFVDNL